MIKKIAQLQPGDSNIEVTGLVISKENDTRPMRMEHAWVTLEDETGTLTLNLWRGQVTQVRVGDFLWIKRGFVQQRGDRLELSTWEEPIEVIEQ